MALAYISGGALTSPAGSQFVKVLEGGADRIHKRQTNISGDGDAATGSFFAKGRPVWNIDFQGVYSTDGTTYPLAAVNDKLTGSTLFTTSRVIVVKTFPVMDVTGSGDAYAESVFAAGRARYSFSGFGWMDSADAVIKEETEDGDDTIGSFIVELTEAGAVVSGPLTIVAYRVDMPFKDGGPVPVRWQGYGNTDAPTVTSTPWSITNAGFTAAFDINTAGGTSSFSGTFIPRQIRGDVDYENTMPTVVRMSGMFSGGQ